VPENVKFVVDNIEEDWLFDVGAGGDGFDLVHLRQMFPVLKGPERVLAQAFEHARPGGWIEIQEFGGTVICDDGTVPPEGYSVSRFMDLCTEALGKFGSDFRYGNKLEEPLKKAGFVNVTCTRLKVPIGTWPRVS